MLQNKKHSKSFSGAIVFISLIGIMLGVSVMILTISVAVGFQTEIKNKLMSFGSHIQVESLYLNNNNETSPIITIQHNIDSLSKNDEIDIISTNKSVYGYFAVSGGFELNKYFGSFSTTVRANVGSNNGNKLSKNEKFLIKDIKNKNIYEIKKSCYGLFFIYQK